ncbi:substrate-binding periplasmic protein [Glycomyces mayteni]|uniref:Substrate-binding periplasmic protein n=1 Tax=Glycomyces mayteni TaxID=543887 RepID=A0ABW2DGJ3_9ACTN|nr:glutamate ABC transporter substrate-binding protein [Glycomyces mayteni]
MRRTASVLCAAALLATGACATDGTESIVDKDVVRIGVPDDYELLSAPGEDGDLAGFEIDVAERLAAELGAEPQWVPVANRDREQALQDGRVDMVVAAYSITAERKQLIDFAGPYVLESFNVMVRAGDDSITTLQDLEGKTVCDSTGSNVIARIRDEHGVQVDTYEVDSYPECLDVLARSEADALATDEFILAGLKHSRPDLDLEILDIRFSNERIGIGLRPGDTAGCEALNRAIAEMYTDGSMALILQEWFAAEGLDVADPPIPQFEGCE